MTTTAVITATTAEDKTVTGSVAAGGEKAFGAFGLVSTEAILIEQRDSAGNYRVIRYLADDGNMREGKLEAHRTLLRIIGPIDYRINKPVTKNAVEVVEYS